MKRQELDGLDFSGWPLDDKYLVEIGRISVLWTSLESQLNLCISTLSGFNDLNDPKPFVLISHSTIPQRIDMLGTLCEMLVRDFPNLKNYKEVIGKIRGAQKLRNKFAHNIIVLNPDTGSVEMATSSARGKLKTNVEQIDTADIRRASVAISEAHSALYKLIFGREISPIWERRKREQSNE